MSRLVEIFVYKGVRFEIMSDTNPDDNDAVFYYWDRHDIKGAGDCSFLPWETVEQVKEDARREMDGGNIVTEEMVQEQMEILKRRMQPN